MKFRTAEQSCHLFLLQKCCIPVYIFWLHVELMMKSLHSLPMVLLREHTHQNLFFKRNEIAEYDSSVQATEQNETYLRAVELYVESVNCKSGCAVVSRCIRDYRAFRKPIFRFDRLLFIVSNESAVLQTQQYGASACIP